MKSDFDTLKNLAAYTISVLVEGKLIEIEIAKRLDLIEDLATELGVSFATDEDIKNQALEEVEEKMGYDELPEDITETEIFNHARKEIIKSFNGENIGGLYMVESLNQAANRIKDFVLESDKVVDVYGTDEDIIEFIIHKVRAFSTKRG